MIVECIRDKIVVFKKKGFWMGGVLFFGYDFYLGINIWILVVNEVEVKIVK